MGEFSRNTLAPLVLRVGLAVMLIYSGYDMVYGRAGTDPEWGTRWADQLYTDPQPRVTYPPERKEKTPPESKEGAPQPQDKVQPPAKGEKTTPEQRTPRLRVTLEQQPVPDKLQDKYVQAVAAWGILVGGIALAIGLMTRMAGLLIILIELGAIYTVTWDRGSLSLGGFGPVGFEYNVVIIVACLTLLLLGGGEFALDRYLFRRKPTAKA